MPVLKNAKHELFAQHVARGQTVDQAYVLAGYQEHRSNAARLSAKEDVRSRIEEIQSKAADRAGMTVERIVRELEKIASSDITDAVEWGEAIAVKPEPDEEGEEIEPYAVQAVILKPSASLPKHVTAAIAEVAKTKEGIRIKFHDKLSALEKLGKFHGIFKDKVEHSGKVTLEQLVNASYAKTEPAEG